MPYFCPNCQSPILDSEPSSQETALTCKECGSHWMQDELQKDKTLPKGTRLGGFELIRPIGVGGMGQVYLANQLSLDREVAVKVLPKELAADPVAMKRFLREVRHTAALEHRCIITIFEAGTESDVGFLAMDYVDGASVDQLIKRNGKPFTEDEALRIVREVAGALRHAWSRQQLLHRDIKPANVMVDVQGRVRLLDLGIAKRPAETRSADKSTLTQRGMAIGTPHYMSPEQARGEQDLDHRSDQYALGGTLYHMLTCKRPFEGTSVVEILSKQINREPEPVEKLNGSLSPGCVRIVKRMMAKKRGERYPDWNALIEDVERVRAGREPKPLEVAPPQPRTFRRTKALTPADTVVPGERGSAGRIVLLVGLLLTVTTLGVLNVVLPNRGEASTELSVQAPIRPAPVADDPAIEPDEPQSPDVSTRIAEAADADQSPLVVADSILAEGDGDGYLEALRLILADHPGNNGVWYRAAAAKLEQRYLETDNLEALEELLLSRLAATGVQAPEPDDFVRAANWISDQGKPKDAEQLLLGAIRQDSEPDVVAACTDALAERYRQANDRQQLRLTLHNACQILPPTHPAHSRFANELRAMDDAVDAVQSTANLPTEDPAIAELRQLMAETANPAERRRLQRRYAAALQQAGRYAESAKSYRDLAAELADPGERADVLLDLARCHMEAKEDGARLEILTELAQLPATPELAPRAVLACRLLADYYKGQRNPFLRNRYLLDVADRYGAHAPAQAAESIFQVAAWHESKGRARTALDLLSRIPAEFAAAGAGAVNRADREIKRINAANPELSGDPVDAKTNGDAPADAIVLDGRGTYVRMGEAVGAVSRAKALTIAFWIRRQPQLPSSRPLVSRLLPETNRGFHLALEFDNTVSFTVGNGASTHFARTGTPIPEDQWVHVAAVAADNKLAVYLNGKLAGQGIYPNDLDFAGTGRLHLARSSWQTTGAKTTRAWFRYVTVYPHKIYDTDFEPTETPVDYPKAVICLTVRNSRIGDLRRNRVDLNP